MNIPGLATIAARDPVLYEILHKMADAIPDAGLTKLLELQQAKDALTGTGAELLLYQGKIEAGRIAAGQGARLSFWWRHTTGVNNVTYNIYVGGAQYTSFVDAGAAFSRYQIELFNRPGSQKAQVSVATNTAGGLSVGALDLALDFTKAVVTRLTASFPNTDKVTPVLYFAEALE